MNNETIAFGTEAAHRHFFLALASELKKRTSRRIIFYVNSPEAMAVYRKEVDAGIIDDVRNFNLFQQSALKLDKTPEAVVIEAQEWEEFIGGSLFRNVLMTNRTAGHAFALAGYGHPQSELANRLDYYQCLGGLNATMRFWQDEIAANNIVAMLHVPREAQVVGKAMSVPSRTLCLSRYKAFYYWSEDMYWSFPRLREAYELTPETKESFTLVQPYLQEVLTRKEAFSTLSITAQVRWIWKVLLRRAYLKIKGYEMDGSYDLLEAIKFILRRKKAIRGLMGGCTRKLESLKGVPFVFYPLQTEPEATFQWISPERFCQLDIIACLARDLPAGTLLAVKETVHGAGRRPPAFYEQITGFKNVIMLDIREVGQDVIQACKAVATVNGTAGLEAAFSGKPVLSFGKHNSYDFLDHVRSVDTTDDLRRAYLDLLRIDFVKAAIDGARLKDALLSVSFDMGSYSALSPTNFSAMHVERACDAVISSLS